MFDDIPSPILREIIKQIPDYKSIILLKLLNKRLNNFITNDVQWKKQYLKIKYSKFQIPSNNDQFETSEQLESFIKFLDSKSYSKFLETGFSKNDELTVFIKPKDDSFVVYSKINNEQNSNFLREHRIETTTKNLVMISKIDDEKINDLENFLFSKEFYKINFCDNRWFTFSYFLPYSTLVCNSSIEILCYDERYNRGILEMVKNS